MIDAATEPAPMRPDAFRVARAWSETADTVTLELRPVRGETPPFTPGQFNMVYALGVGEIPVSISGDPRRPDPLRHTVREVGAVSRAIRAARPGDVLGVRGPYGRGWPVGGHEGDDLVLVAGGLGLAPLRPVVRHVLAHRRRFGKVTLLYGARTPVDRLYAPELDRLGRETDLDVRVTVDAADERWPGPVGTVTGLVPRCRLDPSRVTAFVCGPDIMMRFTVQELRRCGVDPQRIFVSTERNMQCGIGLCGHCQLGPHFVCRDGPVFAYPELAPFLRTPEL